MKKGKWKRLGVFCLLVAAFFFGGAPLSAEAGTLYESSYVTFSPDGEAWTIKEALPAGFNPQGSAQEALNAGVYSPVSAGFTTGTASRLETLQTGQHYYKYVRRGEVPVGEWEVAHAAATCVHGLPVYPQTHHGVSFGTTLCGGRYYSGWVPYCADCGEPITDGYLIYGSSAAIHSITSIDTRLALYFTCPTCNHLEQGTGYEHECQRPSYNRYQVQYDINASIGDANGYVMEPSFHMYNNATEYEGSPVVPQKTLNLNEYERIGYTFVAWNTKPDGSGTSYADGAEILNLTTENYDKDAGTGIVILYAQWRRSESILKVDPNGGTYEGKAEPTVVEKAFNSTYEIDQNKLVAPKGFRVSFDTRGGNAISPMDTTCTFVSWEKSSPFLGKMKDLKYGFTAPDGNVDTVTATYVQGSIVLPTPTKPNSSFGGWFEDMEWKKPVGMGGDVYTPRGDITLYAKWVDLVLYSVTDLSVDHGKGGVDLTWVQSDTLNKTYKIYQSTDNNTFYQISAATQNATEASDLDISYSTEGTKSYTVKSSGYYQIEANGASGKDFGTTYKGGKGGKVSATFYLSKGDVLSITVGKQGGGGSGSSEGGAGGGMTIVKSENKGILLIAGGGGGAMSCANGEDGGAVSTTVSNATAGKSGTAGGGSGATGGTAGSYVPSHTHSEAAGCYHHHSGSATAGGGCYTTPAQVVCGTYQYSHTTWCGWWRYDDDTTKGCQQCNQPLAGHGRTHPTEHYKCSGCGKEATSGGTHYKSGWALGCGKTEGQLICSKSTSPGTITAAKGGSSYISAQRLNIVSTTKGGAPKGNGSVSITAKSVGYSDACKLDDVSANDKVAPEKITTYEKEGVGGDRVLVTWEKPEDNGTVYYHKVESYDSTTSEYLITSNITKNLITTGVAGYYYIVDTAPATKVSLGNAQNKNALLSQDRNSNTCSLKVLMSEQTQYLHLVAVDVAGNLDPEKTVHIRIDYDDTSIDWPIMTKQIQVGSTIGTKNYESVYASPTENKTYYVKADGTTPFFLSFYSYMEGKARDNYMIDYQIFDVRIGETKQQFITRLPYSPVSDSFASLNTAKFVRRVSGTSIMKDAMHTGALRISNGVTTYFHQAFTVGAAYNGQHLKVTPIAGITSATDNGVKYSDWADDSTHAVTLIPDAEGPIILGADAFEGADNINVRDSYTGLTISVSDVLSGLKACEVRIVNKENRSEYTWNTDENGHLSIDFTEDLPLFQGDFSITITAVDHVGNVTKQEYGMRELSLVASIDKVMNRENTAFIRGETAILNFTSYGYAERVEVTYPEGLLAGNNLPTVFNYDVPEYAKPEAVSFVIPLYAGAGEYTIIVRAYKNGDMVESRPTLTVSADGSVLDRVRVRIR